MGAMTTATSLLKFDPEWEVPTEDELEEVAVENKLVRKLRQFHVGLKTINIRASWNSKGQKFTQPLCVVRIVNSGRNKIPGISAELLAKVLQSRIEEHAANIDSDEVKYIFLVYGENDDMGGKFQKQTSVAVDPAELAGEDDDEGEDEEGEEDAAAEEDYTEAEAPGPSSEPAFQEDSEPLPLNKTERPLGRRLPPMERPIRRGNEVRTLRSALAPPQVEAETQQFKEMESELVKIMRLQHQWSAGIFSELRASMQQQRENMSAAMQQVRQDMAGAMQAQSVGFQNILGSVQALMEEVQKDLHHAREEVDQANSRLVEMSDHTLTHFQGQQEANKQGWEAFRAGMQMQLSAMGQTMSWERQMMFMQFDQLASEQKQKQSSPGWVKDFAPLIMAAAGQLLSAAGNPMGETVEKIATDAIHDAQTVPDEEDDEEDSPEENPGQTYDENPLGGMLRLFDSMFQGGKKQAFEKALPPIAKQNYSSALQAKQEALTRSYVMQFLSQIKENPKTHRKVLGLLSGEQSTLFRDIVKVAFASIPGGADAFLSIDVDAAEKPSRPQPDPKAPVAELRMFAKKHYDLTFPARTKKAEILEAIEKAASQKESA